MLSEVDLHLACLLAVMKYFQEMKQNKTFIIFKTAMQIATSYRAVIRSFPSWFAVSCLNF
jgi:hypothetical protein